MEIFKISIKLNVLTLIIISTLSITAHAQELESYYNEELGFSIDYPASWSIKKPVSGDGISIEQKGDDYIQILTLVTKNVRNEGNPYEEIKAVMDNNLAEKNIKPITSWSSESGIAEQYCTTYDEKLPILGVSRITECSSLANEIYYNTKAVAKPEIHERYKDTIDEIVNSFRIQKLKSSEIEQNRIETASKAAGKTFVASLLKWGVVISVGWFVIKKLKKQN